VHAIPQARRPNNTAQWVGGGVNVDKTKDHDEPGPGLAYVVAVRGADLLRRRVMGLQVFRGGALVAAQHGARLQSQGASFHHEQARGYSYSASSARQSPRSTDNRPAQLTNARRTWTWTPNALCRRSWPATRTGSGIGPGPTRLPSSQLSPCVHGHSLFIGSQWVQTPRHGDPISASLSCSPATHGHSLSSI
jgi:hypothetical protein